MPPSTRINSHTKQIWHKVQLMNNKHTSLIYTLVKFKLQNKPSKVPTKIYILSWAHICFKINITLIQTSHPPPREQEASPPGGTPLSLETSELSSLSRTTLGPTQPPIQWVPGVVSQGQAEVWHWPIIPIYYRGQERVGVILVSSSAHIYRHLTTITPKGEHVFCANVTACK
jgi:hypothetical protein